MNPPVVLVAGPTASGKSALALQLAKSLGGEIVGADSMQIYRDLRILTARPSEEDEAEVPHHLVGCVDGAEAWSAGRWLDAAMAVLADLRRRGKTAVVVGGTGLYFRALTGGLAEVPSVPLAAREAAEAQLAALGEDAFRDVLRGLDPVGAERIASRDRQRLVRAMAVARHTGRPLSAWQGETRPALSEGDWTGLVLEPPREQLYRRCDARLETMVAHGALDEVGALLSRRLSPELPIMKAVGVRELAAVLTGANTLDQALAEAQQATRNYAKRQFTWFRNQTPAWPRISAPEQGLARLGYA